MEKMPEISQINGNIADEFYIRSIQIVLSRYLFCSKEYAVLRIFFGRIVTI